MVDRKILEKIKIRFQPLYEEELTDDDASEILNSMNDLVALQHSFINNKNSAISSRFVYNETVTKYNE